MRRSPITPELEEFTQILTRLHFRPSYLSRTFATISPQLYP
mgnify:CR=1 FL=1